MNHNFELKITKIDLIELLESSLNREVLSGSMRVRNIEMHPQAEKCMTITMGPEIPEPSRAVDTLPDEDNLIVEPDD